MAHKGKLTPFNYLNYKDIIKYSEKLYPYKRGFKKLFSKAIGCHPSYLIRVLQGTGHLSLEQGARAGEFWNFSPLENEYFMELLLLERAGSQQLREFHKNRLRRIKEQAQNLSSKIQAKSFDQEQINYEFFSHFSPPLTHLLLLLNPKLTPEQMSEITGYSKATFVKAIELLEELGLILKKKNKYIIKDSQLHLDKNSSVCAQYLLNWRLKAHEQTVIRKNKDDLHYTSLHTLSKSDYDKLRTQLNEFVSNSHAIVKDSPSEIGICINIDAFQLF